MSAATLPHPALDLDDGDDPFPVEVCIDREAAPGDVVPALARLLIDMAHRRLARQKCNQHKETTK